MPLGFSEEAYGSSKDVQLHVARELHDQVAQPLIALIMQVRELQRAGYGANDLEVIEESVRQILRQTRELMIDLREREDLRTRLVEALEKEVLVPDGARLSVQVSTGWPAYVNGWAGFNLLRIVQQAVANAWRHGGARNVQVVLGVGRADDAVVVILDDGTGIAEDALFGFGMTGMQERATILGGSFTAGALGPRGTRVEVRLPLNRLT